MNELENEPTNFPNNFKTLIVFYWTSKFFAKLLKKRKFFYVKNNFLTNFLNMFFIKPTILLNNHSVRKQWKINDNFKSERNQVFLNSWKNWRNGSFTNNERTKWKKSKTRPSLVSFKIFTMLKLSGPCSSLDFKQQKVLKQTGSIKKITFHY